jgi:hypothetical protein
MFVCLLEFLQFAKLLQVRVFSLKKLKARVADSDPHLQLTIFESLIGGMIRTKSLRSIRQSPIDILMGPDIDIGRWRRKWRT